MSVRDSGRHVEGMAADRESPCVGAAVMCPTEERGAKECRGGALRLCPSRCPAPLPALRPAPAPSAAEAAAVPRGGRSGVGRWALPRHGLTRGGPSAAPLCCCPPPGQTAAARRGAMAAGLGPWLLALALGPAGARRARRAARPGLGAARAAAPRAR